MFIPYMGDNLCINHIKALGEERLLFKLNTGLNGDMLPTAMKLICLKICTYLKCGWFRDAKLSYLSKGMLLFFSASVYTSKKDKEIIKIS